jgi:hypothetical protein
MGGALRPLLPALFRVVAEMGAVRARERDLLVKHRASDAWSLLS